MDDGKLLNIYGYYQFDENNEEHENDDEYEDEEENENSVLYENGECESDENYENGEKNQGDESYIGEVDYDEGYTFQAMARLYEDGFFSGFSTDDDDNGKSYLITGFYDENLGLSMLRFPVNSTDCPEYFRTLSNGDGSFDGQFIQIQKQNHFIFTGYSLIDAGSRINFYPKGNSEIGVAITDLDFYANSAIESVASNYENLFKEQEFKMFYEKSFKHEAVKEQMEDLKTYRAEQAESVEASQKGFE